MEITLNMDEIKKQKLGVQQAILCFLIYSNNKELLNELAEINKFKREDYEDLIAREFLFTTAEVENFSFVTTFITDKCKNIIPNLVWRSEEKKIEAFMNSSKQIQGEPLELLTVVESRKSKEDSFNEFWDAFPDKRGISGTPLKVNKKECRKLYYKLIEDSVDDIHNNIMKGLELSKDKEVRNKDFQYHKNSLYFLQERTWEAFIEIEEKEEKDKPAWDTGGLLSLGDNNE